VKKKLSRKTKETDVRIVVSRAGTRGLGAVRVSTGLVFYDHMLTTLLRYAGLDAEIEAQGDLSHHVMEDVAILLGRAIRSTLTESAARFGERTIPMDDALVQACVDVGGRFYFEGKLPNRLHTHVLRSLSESLGATLHVRILRGKDRHHVIEAAYKATGLALRDAMSDTGGGVFSLKGTAVVEEETLP
jgi:imidazoleglycerol-phosphate dehydratase